MSRRPICECHFLGLSRTTRQAWGRLGRPPSANHSVAYRYHLRRTGALRLAEPAETSQRPANEAQGAELQRPQTPSDFRDLIKCAASARKKDGTSPMLVLTEGDNDNGHSDVCL